MIAILYISDVDLGDLVKLKELLINKWCYVFTMSLRVAAMIHI